MEKLWIENVLLLLQLLLLYRDNYPHGYQYKKTILPSRFGPYCPALSCIKNIASKQRFMLIKGVVHTRLGSFLVPLNMLTTEPTARSHQYKLWKNISTEPTVFTWGGVTVRDDGETTDLKSSPASLKSPVWQHFIFPVSYVNHYIQ